MAPKTFLDSTPYALGFMAKKTAIAARAYLGIESREIVLTGNDALGDRVLLQTAFDELALSGGTLVLGGTFLVEAGVSLSADNAEVWFQGGCYIRAHPTLFPDGTNVFSVTGTNTRLQAPKVDGENKSGRGLIVARFTDSLWINDPILKNFQAPASSGATISPYALRVAGDTRNVFINNLSINGVNNLNAAGGAVGVHITATGFGEAAPWNIQIRGGTVQNITPAFDGDGIRFQNDWPGVHIGSVVSEVTFTGCAKRGVKVMLAGVDVLFCDVISPGYAGISVYESHCRVIGCTVIDGGGDMCIDVGSSLLTTLTDIEITHCILSKRLGSDVLTTGDGIRFIGSDIRGGRIAFNKVKHVRVGVHLTGGVQNTTVCYNFIEDTTQAGVQVSSWNISGTDYFPNTVAVDGNDFVSIGTVPVVMILVNRPKATGNILNGTGTVVAFASCTGGIQGHNYSDSDSGELSSQFDRDSNGKMRIKELAVLTNIIATSIAIDGATAGSGGILQAKRAANFHYSMGIWNTSNGNAAVAGMIYQNDTLDTWSEGLCGSGHASLARRMEYIGSASMLGVTWKITNGTYDFQVNAESSLKLDRSTTAGETRMMVWDVDTGAAQRVKVGAAGTGPGGVGRALYLA